MKVWKDSIELTSDLFDFIDHLEGNKEFSLSNQFSRALISISNNIAEGSGSHSDKEFARFLNISHRSTFECINLLHLIELKGLISKEVKEEFITQLDKIGRQLEGLRRHLRRRSEIPRS